MHATVLFGRGVAGRSQAHGILRLARLKEACNAEIDQVEMVVGGHHHIVWLQVAEDNRRLVAMEVAQDGAELDAYIQYLGNRKLLLRGKFQAARQRLTVNIVHNEIPASVLLEVVIDVRQVGMRKAGEQLRFVPEGDDRTLHLLRIEPTHAHLFGGADGIVEEHILYFVDRAEASLPQLLHNAIALFQLIGAREQARSGTGIDHLRLPA